MFVDALVAGIFGKWERESNKTGPEKTRAFGVWPNATSEWIGSGVKR